MYFLIFQTDDMLNFYLNFNESQPIHAYGRYDYKKSVTQLGELGITAFDYCPAVWDDFWDHIWNNL